MSAHAYRFDMANRRTTPNDVVERLAMKSFDSRVYNINDFVEWEANKQLTLNPVFQRRSVWSEKAKSFLMDTIIRGKPIPKFFIRQQINVSTKSSNRDVVDGQQRLRTILSYIKDGFSIARSQNKEFGGKLFSQLDEGVQSQILSYEVSVDLLINLPDTEVLDIFSRLNSYAVTLNEQEKLNAEYFGAFKILADHIGRKYNTYWKVNSIFTNQQVLRMSEVSLVSELIIAMLEGIKNKRSMRRYYGIYEKTFDFDPSDIEDRFDKVVSVITRLYPDGLAHTEFNRPFLFYSLFTAVAHCLYGLPNFEGGRINLADDRSIEFARNRLDRVLELFAAKDVGELDRSERAFLQNSRRATTDVRPRENRTQFLLNLMS